MNAPPIQQQPPQPRPDLNKSFPATNPDGELEGKLKRFREIVRAKASGDNRALSVASDAQSQHGTHSEDFDDLPF